MHDRCRSPARHAAVWSAQRPHMARAENDPRFACRPRACSPPAAQVVSATGLTADGDAGELYCVVSAGNVRMQTRAVDKGVACTWQDMFLLHVRRARAAHRALPSCGSSAQRLAAAPLLPRMPCTASAAARWSPRRNLSASALQEADVALSAMTVVFDIHSKGKWGSTPTIAQVGRRAGGRAGGRASP